MGDGGENQDLAAMKKLLTSWHVGVLYNFFKEEDITINELKMMEFSHIYDLMKQHKMGVRIRFEYHLNSWRNKIGIPLRNVHCNQYYANCCWNSKTNVGNNAVDDQNAQDVTTNMAPIAKKSSRRRGFDRNGKQMEQTELNENQTPLSPQSINSNNSLVNTPNTNPNQIVNFMPAPVLESPSGKSQNTDDETEMENLPLNTLSDILSDGIYDKPPKFPSKPTSDKCPVTLRQILEMSGAQGSSILSFFKEKNRLTNIHRSQLIQIIVDFFDKNDFHLSLNMSHIFEWEILKMFPTEKLEYYRTEKRGKIYVKFTNMKRYKRERSNKVKTEMELLSGRHHRTRQIFATQNAFEPLVQENNVNMETTNGGNWYVEPEIFLKEENASDNELHFEQD